MRSAQKLGFTLLEVMVAMSILALAITAMAGVNVNSFEASNYARNLTVATLLARSKMIDLEMELQKDGFSEEDKEYDGDFSEEGYTSMRWSATVRKVEVDISQLVGGLFGGEVNPDQLPDQMAGFISAMSGGATDEKLTEQVQGSELSKMLGGGQLELILKQVGETLKNSIREVTLEIHWGKSGDADSVRFVQYLTTTGRLSFNPAAAPQALVPGGRIPQSVIPPNIGGLPTGINPNELGGKP